MMFCLKKWSVRALKNQSLNGSNFILWFIDNKLSIHFGEDKTKSILFTRIKTPAKLNISFQDHLIKQYNRI